jgi:hypothetical protein
VIDDERTRLVGPDFWRSVFSESVISSRFLTRIYEPAESL